MPEGDTIRWLAERLRRAILGRVVRAVTARTIPDAATRALVGRRVTTIEARGKNLLVGFDDGQVLHVHLRMLGRVRVEAARRVASREALRGPSAPELRLDVDGAVVTGRRIPVLRLLRAGAAARAPGLADLGPDLLDEAFDEAEAVRRLRALGARAIGEAVMIQRAVAGIGNVYKSEVLFLERVHPEERIAALDDAALRRILARARALLRMNVRAGARRTRGALAGPRLWVYGRARSPCLACGAPLLVMRQGALPGRSTYYCGACQVQSSDARCPAPNASQTRSAPSSRASRSGGSAGAPSSARSTSRSR